MTDTAAAETAPPAAAQTNAPKKKKAVHRPKTAGPKLGEQILKIVADCKDRSLVQIKGTGASGSFRVAKKEAQEKVGKKVKKQGSKKSPGKKPAAKKPKKAAVKKPKTPKPVKAKAKKVQKPSAKPKPKKAAGKKKFMARVRDRGKLAEIRRYHNSNPNT
ncbi:histone H1-like [Heptranchias perlo]|uniref:histone H1-like n=1 Tax=Heptranchias perlo TaxID=212740 RepID=UPI00355A9BF6